MNAKHQGQAGREEVEAPGLFDAVIIGGGPSGCSCALWLKMLGFSACIVDRRKQLGGLQNDSPYQNRWIAPIVGLTGQDVAAQMHQHMNEHGVALRLGFGTTSVHREGDVFAVTNADGGHIRSRNLVIATGVVPFTAGFKPSQDILIGPGAHIHKHDFAGKRVAILGGGDNAFENYLFAKDKGARSVRIFARSIRARNEFLRQAIPEDILVGGITVDCNEKTVNGEHFDAIIVLYGWQANIPFKHDLPLNLDSRGFVQTDRDCQASVPNVFAIGEIAQRMHPCCVTAMADGVVAAKAIQKHLEAAESKSILAKFVHSGADRLLEKALR